MNWMPLAGAFAVAMAFVKVRRSRPKAEGRAN